MTTSGMVRSKKRLQLNNIVYRPTGKHGHGSKKRLQFNESCLFGREEEAHHIYYDIPHLKVYSLRRLGGNLFFFAEGRTAHDQLNLANEC